jgi:3-hydroxyacyl-CoA dehydrogenase/enoyl-CoA hydratase/3-hydroxybutyryl-CoA epimerase
LIITSAHAEFVAGADLKLLLSVRTKDEVYQLIGQMHRTFRNIEKSPFPVVAAINGTALGGGYEIGLACHHRIAIADPKLQIGLPEVTLGLLPGGGGTQRLPRLIGFQKAMPLLMQGTKLGADAAKASGLVDALVTGKEQLLSAARDWCLNNPSAQQPWDAPKYRNPDGEIQSPKAQQTFAAAVAMLHEKTRGNYPAPRAILSCMYEGLQVPFDQAIEIETKYFTQLVLSREAKMMIRTLFFGINECNKGVARPKDQPKKEVKKLAILGAGMMGSGIAYVSAKAGMEVLLKDRTPEVAQNGKSYSDRILSKDLERGRITESTKQQILSRIQPTTDPDAVQGAHLIIEAVIEDRRIKAQVTHESEKVTGPETIFGSNTSTLPITGLAAESTRPKNFIGIHFFSPVEKMQLVEVILGQQTGPEAIATTLDYIRAIGKTPIVVHDGRGFYTSRVFSSYVEEGVMCLNDGAAPALIENAGVHAGMPVGPLCVADEVSLDLIYHILEQTKKDVGPQAVHPEMDRIMNLFVKKWNRLGRKSGQGFYDYPKEGKKHLWKDLAQHFPVRGEHNMGDLKQRLLWRQVVETLQCLNEGVLMSARDADVGSVLGWGFPPFTGGTASFIDFVGAEKFLNVADSLVKRFGKRFEIPAPIRETIAKNHTLYPGR